MKHARQSRTASPQQAQGHEHVAAAADQIGLADSPYLTLEEGARIARFDDCQHPVRAFYAWLVRHAIPIRHRGRKVLVERRVLLAVLARG